jgi:hypothetical protein
MRTEDAADLLGGLVDIAGGDAGKTAKPHRVRPVRDRFQPA